LEPFIYSNFVPDIILSERVSSVRLAISSG
jgi:hypothetical protein